MLAYGRVVLDTREIRFIPEHPQRPLRQSQTAWWPIALQSAFEQRRDLSIAARVADERIVLEGVVGRTGSPCPLFLEPGCLTPFAMTERYGQPRRM